MVYNYYVSIPDDVDRHVEHDYSHDDCYDDGHVDQKGGGGDCDGVYVDCDYPRGGGIQTVRLVD